MREETKVTVQNRRVDGKKLVPLNHNRPHESCPPPQLNRFWDVRCVTDVTTGSRGISNSLRRWITSLFGRWFCCWTLKTRLKSQGVTPKTGRSPNIYGTADPFLPAHSCASATIPSWQQSWTQGGKVGQWVWSFGADPPFNAIVCFIVSLLDRLQLDGRWRRDDEEQTQRWNLRNLTEK